MPPALDIEGVVTQPDALEVVAARLARLLSGGGQALFDPDRGSLEFEPEVVLRPLARAAAPPAEAWAVDGGQALVADARCIQLLVTRAARVRFEDGQSSLEDEGEVRAHLLGQGEDAVAVAGLASLGFMLPRDTSVDVNLLRDSGEWEAVSRCVEDASPGAVVLVDGDLLPDWRLPRAMLTELLDHARRRGVVLAGVTKHSSLARGGAPLLGQLELEAEDAFGPRSRWWALLAHARPGAGGPAVQVLAARLDPDARFAFRVDLPADADAPETLGSIAALSDDAAFPGYPYPLAVADRLAACPRWLRQDLWLQVDAELERAGIPFEVRERAFADRHALMERF